MGGERTPLEVDDIALAFGGDIKTLMPSRDEIPEEFWNRHTYWSRVVGDWFFSGLRDAKWKPRDGIDEQTALRHVAAILRSWEPKHEHKEAAVAYLLSLWFLEVSYSKGEAAS
jgi:hypothetical protein